MGQDEKTLRIVVSKDSGNPSPQQQPSAPPSPRAPANPSTPAQPPSNQTSPSAPPSPTVTLPKSPPQVADTPAVAPTTPVTPTPTATGTAAATGEAAVGVAEVAEGATALGLAFPPLLIIVGIVTAALGGMAVAVHLVDNAFSAMVDRLKQFDPGLAVASSISQMRKIQADFQAARERSGVLQQFTQRKTDLEVSVSRIETFVTNHIGPAVIKILDLFEGVAIIAEAIIKKIEEAEDAISQHIPALLRWMIPIFWDWREINKKLARWLGVQLDSTADASTFQKDLLDAIDPHGALTHSLREQGRAQEGTNTPRGIEL